MTAVTTCEAEARRGTGTGMCGEPLDELGGCPQARRHLDAERAKLIARYPAVAAADLRIPTRKWNCSPACSPIRHVPECSNC